MKKKYNFLNPLLMAILAMCCLWIVTDVAYEVRIWERSATDWTGRIQAFIVVLVNTTIAYLFFNYLANIFLDKNKENRRRPQVLEYLLATLFILITFNISLYIILTFINNSTYRWGEFQMINATATPIFLLYYTSIRNKILSERYTQKIIQLEKLKVDQLDTELKLLRSQYHPHFLFNALNTIYFLIDEDNEAATEAIDQLSDLLRYQLYDIKAKVSIQQEIKHLRTYIEFQKLRMPERLQLDYFFDPSLADQKIHPLLFQPLLENAFKYVGGEYRIELRMQKEGDAIRFTAGNTISPIAPNTKEESGIGIISLRKRLHLLYPNKHNLLTECNGTCFTVNLLIQLSE